MTTVVRAEQAGERRRIGAVSSQDELGELARQFDHMLDLLDERNREIRRAATELEAKVESRTRELLDKNIRLQNTINLLQQTRQRLITAEKLAAVGELTAGIAHEINNPTAVILGNMDVVISELGAAVEPVATEVELIIAQVYRIRAIVDQLLQYSRPSQYVGYVEELDVNRLIRDTLPLVQHELERRRARLDQSLQAGTRIRINRQELQQVLVNLLVNAAHALPAGGRIELHTRDWPDKGVVIGVKDYGSGIPRERLGRVFDPFYTTKQGGGTGLGLSVSYGLVRRYGGQITVDSEEGQWTHFEVYLRRVPVFVDEDELPEDSDFRSEAG